MKRLSLTLTFSLLAISTLWPARAASQQEEPDYILYEVTASVELYKSECEPAVKGAGEQAKDLVTKKFITAQCPAGYPVFAVAQEPYVVPGSAVCVDPPGPGAWGYATAKGKYSCSQLPPAPPN